MKSPETSMQKRREPVTHSEWDITVNAAVSPANRDRKQTGFFRLGSSEQWAAIELGLRAVFDPESVINGKFQ